MVMTKRWLGVQEEVLYATYTDLLSENAVATSTTIEVTVTPASTYFAVGMSIRIEDSVNSEENEIFALPGGDVITTRTALANNYTTANGAKVTILPGKRADLLSENAAATDTHIDVSVAVASTWLDVGMVQVRGYGNRVFDSCLLCLLGYVNKSSILYCLLSGITEDYIVIAHNSSFIMSVP